MSILFEYVIDSVILLSMDIISPVFFCFLVCAWSFVTSGNVSFGWGH